MCGTVDLGSARRKKDAAKATDQLVGTQLLTGLQAEEARPLARQVVHPRQEHAGRRAKIQLLERAAAQGLRLSWQRCASRSWTRSTGSPEAIHQRNLMPFLPQILAKRMSMKRIILSIASGCAALAAPAAAICAGRSRASGRTPRAASSSASRPAAMLIAAPSARRRPRRPREGRASLRHPDPQRSPPRGDGTYKGRAFDPKRNIRASATIRAGRPEHDGREGLRACWA